MTTPFDAIVVGSGVNSLAAAALLTRAGWSVAVLERADVLGGACRTAEATVPGFRHDLLAAWHPLWVTGAAHAVLADDLARHGLEYRNSDLPAGTLFPDGQSAFLHRTTAETAAGFERHAPGDGEAWARAVEELGGVADLSFGVLGAELWSRAGLRLAWRAYRRLGRAGLARFAGDTFTSARAWLDAEFSSDAVKGLLAPWGLHAGLGPDDAMSGLMTKVIAIALQDAGCPTPRGGSARLVEALCALIEAGGGELHTDADVERVLVGDGRARGVQTADGRRFEARRAVIANVTPGQLYGRLLADVTVPADVRQAAERFRPGRAAMQIHLALSEPPRFAGDDDGLLARCADIHVTPGVDGVSRAVNEAVRGLLPAEATIVLGQPLNLDPSRAPEGRGLLWIQLQELPWHVRGDAAGELDVGDGSWTESLRERYTDRILARLERHIPNLASATLARTVLSPADLVALNVNFERGDPYGGELSLDQSLLWRPSRARYGHATPLPDLWHVGASTHPGPGLGGGSGTLVAQQLIGSGRRRGR